MRSQTSSAPLSHACRFGIPLLLLAAASAPALYADVHCPPADGENARKVKDLDGDGVKDWFYPRSGEKDGAGNIKLLWCLNHGAGSQFVWEYVAGPGEPGAGKHKFIGFCEFVGGGNIHSCVQRLIDGKRRFVSSRWTNSDVRNKDRTVKQRIYDFDTRTCKLTQTTVNDDGTRRVNENADPPMNDGDRHIGLPLPAGQQRLALRQTSPGEEEPPVQTYPIPPTCELTAQSPAGITVTAQDSESGLASIQVTRSENATVTVPSFPPGTQEPVTVEALKIDLTQPSRVELAVRDVDDNLTACDPVLTLVVRERGKPERAAFTGLPEAESLVSLYGGPAGLPHLDVWVNGVRFRTGVAAGEEVHLDVSAAMQPGEGNVVVLAARGKPGSSATVLIHD